MNGRRERSESATLTEDGQGLLLRWLGSRDSTSRAAYVTWLEARADPRAELLRLDEELSGELDPAASAAKQARLEELLAEESPGWWRWVREAAGPLNCGKAGAGSLQVRFAFQCPRNWQTLAPTATAGVRWCDGCSQQVFWCASAAEAEARAREGQCVALRAALVAGAADAGAPASYTGRMTLEQRWAAKAFPGE